MIQDIAPKKYVNHYEEQSPAAEDWMLVYRDGKVLCRFDNEKIYFPKVKEITQEEQDVTYLFTISDERFFLLKNGLDGELEGYSWEKPEMPDLNIVDLRELRACSFLTGIVPISSVAAAVNRWFRIIKKEWFTANAAVIWCIRRSARELL